MLAEVVQDRLPTFALLRLRMNLLSVEAYGHSDSVRALSEIHPPQAIAERVFNQFQMHHIRVLACEIKPEGPSLASIREENLPPGRRSTLEAVVCQSGDAVFQSLMSSGVVYAAQTTGKGAAICVETVIFNFTPLREELDSKNAITQPTRQLNLGQALR
jgi:hypothetical protein